MALIYAALRDLSAVVGFFACASWASSSPLRTAVIKMSMTTGILLSAGTAIPFLPFSNSIGFRPHGTKKDIGSIGICPPPRQDALLPVERHDVVNRLPTEAN
jgi:hypothetical protein